MADVNDGDIVRIGAGLIYDGLYDVVNVWHVRVDTIGGATWAELTNDIQAWLNNLMTDLKDELVDGIGTGSVSVSNATQLTTLGSIPWSPTWAGAQVSDPTASGVSCFSWARTYKPRVQIRKYFGVFSEAGITGGFWIGAVQDACDAAMVYAIATQGLGGDRSFQAVAYNRTLRTSTIARSVAVAAEPGYQRRRKRGAGS